MKTIPQKILMDKKMNKGTLYALFRIYNFKNIERICHI